MKKSELKKLPVSIRRKYSLTNGVRTVTLFIGWLLSAVLFIYALTTGEQGAANILFAPLFGGGFIHGIFHAEFLYKKAFKGLGLIVGFFVSVFIFMLAAYSGFIFLIIDTILFIKKKPLIYSFEDKHFLTVENIAELLEGSDYEIYEYEIPSDLDSDAM